MDTQEKEKLFRELANAYQHDRELPVLFVEKTYFERLVEQLKQFLHENFSGFFDKPQKTSFSINWGSIFNLLEIFVYLTVTSLIVFLVFKTYQFFRNRLINEGDVEHSIRPNSDEDLQSTLDDHIKNNRLKLALRLRWRLFVAKFGASTTLIEYRQFNQRFNEIILQNGFNCNDLYSRMFGELITSAEEYRKFDKLINTLELAERNV